MMSLCVIIMMVLWCFHGVSCHESLNVSFIQTLPGRFVEGVYIATELLRSDSFLHLICPPEQMVGLRGATHIPKLMGQRCEPWQCRESVEVLWHLLDHSMTGLEWSSGSGTTWLLRRGLNLFSIEHCSNWLDEVQKAIKDNMPHLLTRWHPVSESVEACNKNEPVDYSGQEKLFGKYSRYPAEHLKDYMPFDFVSVDGRFRDGCIVEALKIGFLKSNYGILLLDNADRSQYLKPETIPSHWLVVSFVNLKEDETTIWMSCPRVDDEDCSMARKQIKMLMENVPTEHIGSRYNAHMSRYRKEHEALD